MFCKMQENFGVTIMIIPNTKKVNVGLRLHFVILGFGSLQLKIAFANEINHDIHLANALF